MIALFKYVYKEFYKYFTWGSNRRFWEMIRKTMSNKEFMAQLRQEAQRNLVFTMRPPTLNPNYFISPIWDISKIN